MAALRGAEAGNTVFPILDSIAFVRIETTSSKEEVVGMLEKLREINRLLEAEDIGRNWPINPTTRKLLIDYNDYCARMRLAELETRT